MQYKEMCNVCQTRGVADERQLGTRQTGLGLPKFAPNNDYGPPFERIFRTLIT